MTENDVKVIVDATLEVYESKTGAPRHAQNIEKFDKLFGALNWIKGAAWTFGALLTVLNLYFHLKK